MLTKISEAPLPTRHGLLRAVVFRNESGIEHMALVSGDVARSRVLVRVHSECLTSEAFGSLKCDCSAQLDDALERIATAGGVVLYLRDHEGRGIGLGNKIRAYALQAEGVDTVDANRILGLPDDARSYQDAAEMLRALGVQSVLLITNNPTKIYALKALGIPVELRVPSLVPVSMQAANYLATKRDRMHHQLPTTLESLHE